VTRLALRVGNGEQISTGTAVFAMADAAMEILFDLVGLSGLPSGEMTLSRFEEAQEAEQGGPTWSLGIEDNDVTTPDEMTRLLELIARGEAAGRESCDQILGIMAKCQTGPARMPKYLPARSVRLERKTGSLPA